jgi:mannose-6-phosphate isomerase-like protein (cupin superfamily)
MIRIASLDKVPATQMPGRLLRWVINRQTLGTKSLGMAVMDCPGHSVVRPCHGHRDVEEVIFILEGEGEAWVDGEVAAFRAGDAVLFPTNSKHQVRNTGPGNLRTCSIFAHPDPPESYVSYEGEGFDAGAEDRNDV